MKTYNADFRSAATKYKHTHTAFVEAFKKELAKLLLKSMDAQELQYHEKVSIIWVKYLNKIVSKMNNTVSSMIGNKPKDAIKLDTITMDKAYPEETLLPEDGLYRYLYQSGEQHGDQKGRVTELIWSKNTIVQEPSNHVLYHLQDEPNRAFVREELVHVSEGNQVPPDWVSGWI